jgi:hypothetical protein
MSIELASAQVQVLSSAAEALAAARAYAASLTGGVPRTPLGRLWPYVCAGCGHALAG